MGSNLSGIAGVAIGGAIGYGFGQILESAGLPTIDCVACGTMAGGLSASMFALLYDRSTIPEFKRSYQVLTKHLFKGPDADYDPRERMAVFAVPVVYMTVVPMVLSMWLYAFRQDWWWVAMYVVASIACFAATFILGNMTVEHRLLQREIAFNTTPLADGAQPQPAYQPQPIDPVKSRLKDRRDAVICIALGLVTLAVHHYWALRDGHYYPKIAFAMPMIIMIGVFGLFEPRIMSRHKPIGKTYPTYVLLLMLLAMTIGGIAGWQLDSWYHS
ncbi:MAG TPA: hypothetical protein VJ901_20825 [Thermoanaerobaculia bacterium]|nr:hypothetical protein [Thermoanaerobaculia bacterium]